MPRWFGIEYNRHHQHHHHPGQIHHHPDDENISDHSHQNYDQDLQTQTQSLSYLSSFKNYFTQTLLYQLTNSSLPNDYYSNPDYHNGFTQEYLHLTLYARDLVENDYFNYSILIVIIIAGINIGIQSYQELSNNYYLSLLDDCILIVFSVECLLKMFSEGLAPYLYFIGPEWKWNTFDFTIVFMSLPFWGSLFGGGSLALLRLVRLMRLGKLIRKVPQLQMIVQGLTGGLSSIGYILLLLFLVFYLFAIAGYYIFNLNDPFHFGSLPKALVTCFQCATLDAWSDIMYLNSYGCDTYPMVYDLNWNQSTATSTLLRCAHPEGQFVVSTIYFVLLVVITALVMLSLFIGAVTLSMQDSLTELKELAADKKRQEQIKKQLNKMFQTRAEITRKNGASKHLKGRVMSRMTSLKMIRSSSNNEARGGGGGGGRGDHSDGSTSPQFPTQQQLQLHDDDSYSFESFAKTSSKKFFNFFSTSSKILEFPSGGGGGPSTTLGSGLGLGPLGEKKDSESPCLASPNQDVLLSPPFSRPTSPILVNFQSGIQIPQLDSSSSLSESSTSHPFPHQHKHHHHHHHHHSHSSTRRQSKSHHIGPNSVSDRVSPLDLLAQAELSYSSESSEAVEMRRKLRIGVGDLPAEIEDETKSLENFFIRWEMKVNLEDRILLLAEHSKHLSDHHVFVQFVTYIILLAGVTVGIATDPRLMSLPYVTESLHSVNTIILIVFTIECALKLFGEYPKPWHYFIDSWNKFDFIIVIGSYTPGVGSLLTMLRLLRLLRVLKLVKSLPQLVVIVNALMMGMESIAYIALILFLCFYLFAIIGMMLFRSNDPFNFGTLHVAMFTLFRCSTLDAWADVMYINIYGCDIYPGDTYSSYPELCSSPHGSGLIAALFFLIFIVIGAQILLTLFIGVVTTSMEEAQAKETRENKVERQLLSLKSSLDLTSVQVRMFRDVFNMLDLDGGGLIEEDEVQIGLKAIGDLVEGTNVEEEIKKADPHGKGIDLVTFIVVFCNIPSCRHRRVLRKTVRRWIANKKKRGVFFQEPRRYLLRKKTKNNIWATNAWNFFENVEKRFASSSGKSSSLGVGLSHGMSQENGSNISSEEPSGGGGGGGGAGSRSSLLSLFTPSRWRLSFSSQKDNYSPQCQSPFGLSAREDEVDGEGDSGDEDGQGMREREREKEREREGKDGGKEEEWDGGDLHSPNLPLSPTFLTPTLLKQQKGSLVRRSSTTTLYQTAHEVETAASIGHHLSSSPELERLASGRRSHSIEKFQSGSRSSSRSGEVWCGRKTDGDGPSAYRVSSPSSSFRETPTPTIVRDFGRSSDQLKDPA
jgi:voltage-gated sodium channel